MSALFACFDSLSETNNRPYNQALAFPTKDFDFILDGCSVVPDNLSGGNRYINIYPL